MRILVVGDSFPAGFYDYERGGWPIRLRTAVMDPKKNIQVYDRSMSGDTTEYVLKRLDIDCKSIWPDVILPCTRFLMSLTTRFKRSAPWLRISSGKSATTRLVMIVDSNDFHRNSISSAGMLHQIAAYKP